MEIKFRKIWEFLKRKVLDIDLEDPGRDLRFIIYSIIGLLVDLGLFYFLREELGWPSHIANRISYPTGICTTFIFNNRLNYKNENYAFLRFLLMLSLHGMSMLIQDLSIRFLFMNKIGTVIENALLMWFSRKLVYRDWLVNKLVRLWRFVRRHLGIWIMIIF